MGTVAKWFNKMLVFPEWVKPGYTIDSWQLRFLSHKTICLSHRKICAFLQPRHCAQYASSSYLTRNVKGEIFLQYINESRCLWIFKRLMHAAGGGGGKRKPPEFTGIRAQPFSMLKWPPAARVVGENYVKRQYFLKNRPRVASALKTSSLTSF